MKLFLIALLLSAGSLFAQCGIGVSNCVVVAWNAGTGGGTVTTFNVQRAVVTGGPYTQIATVAAPIVTYTDNSGVGNVLTQGATYFYVISATGPGGTSPNSAEASAKIPFSAPSTPTNPTATAH